MKVFSEGSFLGNFGIEQFAYAFEILKCFSILSHFSQALGNLKKKKTRSVCEYTHTTCTTHLMDPSKSLQNFCLAGCLVSVSAHSLTTLLFLDYDNMALFQIVFYSLIVLGSKSFFQLADLLLVRVRADKLSKLVNQPVFHFSRLRAETQW